MTTSSFRPRRRTLAAFGLGALTATTAAACSNADPLDQGAGSGGSGSGGSGSGVGGASDAGGAALVIGSQQYYSNEIIAELFAQALEAAGITVTRQYQIGQREVYLPEVESGAIDVMPEYTGNLLQFYQPDAPSASPEEIASALAEALPGELRVLDFAEASDQDTYTTTGDFAQQNQLRTMADLARVDGLKIAANSEFSTRPYGPDGLQKTYGATVEVVPVEDSGGPLTVKALTDGTVQLADLYSADPAIEKNGFVVLEDPEALILPQNVVPLVSQKVDEAAAEAIRKVTSVLTATDLRTLNARSVDEQAKSADIARDWLAEKGITQG
ncbi:ABC transporter substrate-binding protein [Brachybacterium sp. EF45031]|uniref:ABC transporter substrate-binding protein n=1 Tax=Brachybacterium sillae TaxID=2810536 RepID=UPI00217DF926|nr:ABC transporter substrate-binding protein [Brachybacterium sillae]MCS6711538.1 ABC transporter substrate-binding protein [Brachybacterium sillae]